MTNVNLTQDVFSINGVEFVFPIDIGKLKSALGEYRHHKAKYNHIFTWGDLGIFAYSKNGDVAENFLLSLKVKKHDFCPSRVFEGEFMFDGQEILSYRAANKNKLIKLFSSDEGKAFVLNNIRVWFDVDGDVVEAIELGAYEAVASRDESKLLCVDERYKYLELLWQEWIDEIAKIVPSNNRYYNLTRGIGEEDIKNHSRLETGIDIPDELVNFYKIHDVEYDGVTSVFSFSANGFDYDLIPFRNIAKDWGDMQDLQFGDSIEELDLEKYSAKVKANDYANPKWIPFAEGRNGDYLLFDMAPGKEGRYGQIIELQNESWERNVVADSLEELLRNEINSLKNRGAKKFDFILGKTQVVDGA